MIVAIVTFDLPRALATDEARALFLGTAPRYLGVDGLRRKDYVLSRDGRTTGAIYHWDGLEQAKAQYSDEWRAFVTEKYGGPPTILYLDGPVTVDNLAAVVVDNG